ncbi:MAG TPA: hypothetical protein VMG35_21625 [Bryobacteraceae bacterium]|nr:hypothetical protein [Bryobacteraceae bacterium]
MGKRIGLQQYFSAFPFGAPGAGLLLLRLATGATVMVQGWLYLADRGRLALDTASVGSLALVSGLLLLAGLLTPVVGSVIAMGALGIAGSWLPPSNPSLFTTKLPMLLLAAMGVALALLGPGGCSLDALLFGRREIIIPPSSRSPEP